jgi:ribose transport system ATP-binding protein
MSNVILETKNITKKFPGVTAIDDVSLTFRVGEVHAIVGENGAGKSTLMKVLAGSIIADQGKIIYEGETFVSFTPQGAISRGISTIYQEFSLIPLISVGENIFLGQKHQHSGYYNPKLVNKKARELMTKFGINLDPSAIVADLSPAQQQMVEILRAISRKVKILIMDEPSAPLAYHEIEILFNVIRRLKKEGVSIVYISHRMDEIFLIADTVSILRDGCFIDTLPVADTNKDELIKLIVGRNIEQLFPEREYKPGPVFFEIKGLNRANILHNINFAVHKGEIVGIGGLVGSGRTELVRSIFGADPIDNGETYISGKKQKIKSPLDAIRAGIVLIPEDRKNQGIIKKMSVADNITLAIIKTISHLFVIKRSKKNNIVNEYIERLNIKISSKNEKVLNLSGGNQQKVVISKMMATNADIIILDEPTRGIDIGAKHEIYEIMNNLALTGKTIIMISSDMVELLGISDRLIVMREGKIMGELGKNDFIQETVLKLAAGIEEKKK